MSKPMTATQWKTAMKKWAVDVTYRKGWDGRGRPPYTGSFSNINGIMIHHTGSDVQTDAYVDFLFVRGRSDLPAPLCHAATNMVGHTFIGATGRANHAGKGSSTVLKKVIAEKTPMRSELEPGVSNTDGNARFYGNEVMYDGGQPMTARQYASVVRWCAAICDHHGWSGASVIGHGEWTTAKWDPGKTDMARLRRDVDAMLANGPRPSPKPPKYKTVRWHGIAFLNTWGDDGGKGQASFADRTASMADDLTSRYDEIVAACEVRKEQEPGFSKAMKARGYVLAGYSHRLAFYALPDVKVGRLSFYRYKTQNKGAIEGILRLRAKVNGHWNHYGVTHLDYRDDFDNGRVKQGKEAVSAMRRLGLRYLLTRVDRSVILGDLNSKTWVLERALEPGGYFDTARKRKPQHSSMVAKKGDDRIDYITTGDKRPVMDSEQITTKSDHRIERCVLGKNVKA